MKFYLLIFSMFICVFGFSQVDEFGDEFEEALEEEVEEGFENYKVVRYKIQENLYHLFPEIDADFFAKSRFRYNDYSSYNHISELFPSSVLKNNSIKWFHIKLYDNDDIPTIRVQKKSDNFYKFFLDNEGNIASIEDYYKVEDCKRDTKNRLISTPNSKEIYYEYGLPVCFINDYDSTLYNYDEQGRVIEIEKYIFHQEYKDSISSIFSTYHKYDNANFSSTMVDNDFDTMYYDKNWRPIRYVSTLWGSPYEKVLTYKNGKIVNFKHIQKAFIDDGRLIITNENFISFAYNEKGLVDIITVKYKDEIYYYKVYYYTE